MYLHCIYNISIIYLQYIYRVQRDDRREHAAWSDHLPRHHGAGHGQAQHPQLGRHLLHRVGQWGQEILHRGKPKGRCGAAETSRFWARRFVVQLDNSCKGRTPKHAFSSYLSIDIYLFDECPPILSWHSTQDRGIPPLSSTTSLVIKVRDIDDMPPRFSQPIYRVSIPEDVPSSAAPQPTEERLVKFSPPVVASDQDHGVNADLIYEITSGNDLQYFEMDPNNAALYLTKR